MKLEDDSFSCQSPEAAIKRDELMNEQTQTQIAQYRTTAQEMGDAALDAMSRGDVGLARTAARQAAQWARIVIQLETGEKLIEPEDETPPLASEIKV